MISNSFLTYHSLFGIFTPETILSRHGLSAAGSDEFNIGTLLNLKVEATKSFEAR